MKTKKNFVKKLVLKKRTVSDLNSKDLHKVLGGATAIPCPTHRTECITECADASGCPWCDTDRCF
jgi:hypothetical protein